MSVIVDMPQGGSTVSPKRFMIVMYLISVYECAISSHVTSFYMHVLQISIGQIIMLRIDTGDERPLC